VAPGRPAGAGCSIPASSPPVLAREGREEGLGVPEARFGGLDWAERRPVVAVGGAPGWWPRWSLLRRGAGAVGVKGGRGSFGRRSLSRGCAQAVATAGENGKSTATASMAWRHGVASADSSAQRGGGGPARLGRSGSPYRRRAGSENGRGAARAGRGQLVRRRAGGQEQGLRRRAFRGVTVGQRGLRGSSACVLPRDGAGCVGKAQGRLGYRGTAWRGAGVGQLETFP
jgi:hypothetical protein